jgi:hypothetical protein
MRSQVKQNKFRKVKKVAHCPASVQEKDFLDEVPKTSTKTTQNEYQNYLVELVVEYY